MRIFAGVIVSLLLAIAPSHGGTPVSILDTEWEGVRTCTLKSKGSGRVKEKDVAFTLEFEKSRDWRTTDTRGRSLSGTWARSSDTTFELTLDPATLDLIRDWVRSDLSLPEGDLFVTRSKAKAKVNPWKAKLRLSLRFDHAGSDAVRRVRWKYKGSAGKVSGPGSGSGSFIVEQGWFDDVQATMSVGRSCHTSTLLTATTVLIAGGYGSGTTIHASAEIFDKNNGEFWIADSMDQARANHTASRLRDSAVLMVGGERPGDYQGLASAEIFDPKTCMFRATRSMESERTMHTATVLADGRVLVTGGRTIDAAGDTVWHRSAEIFEPAGERWTRTGNDMLMYRAGHRATLLVNGKVLITGGSGTRVAEIFDPVTNRFRDVEDRMEEIRTLHGAVRLNNGVVFLTDGGSIRGELFDPATETFAATTNSAVTTRSAAVTFEYRPGKVLTVGGIDFGVSFLHASVEQFVTSYMAGPRYYEVSTAPGEGVHLKDPRAYSAWTKLADGSFLITGGLGYSYYGSDLDSALLFTPRD